MQNLRTINVAAIIASCLLVGPVHAQGFRIDDEFARHFSADWIDSWNRKDLKRILAHYSEDAQMSSPLIISRGVDATGRVIGKTALEKYWGPALATNAALKFELQNVLLGVDSIAIQYKSNAGGGRLAVEVFHFNERGLVDRAFAHYSELPNK